MLTSSWEQLPNANISDIDSVELQPVDLSVVQIKELRRQWLVEKHDYIASRVSLLLMALYYLESLNPWVEKHICRLA